MKITFHGGVNEIGGNKILCEEGQTRVWLDFGMSFGQAKRYLAEFLQPKKYNGVNDFLKLGLLPYLEDGKGLYRSDYLKHGGHQTSEHPSYDGMFLSHAHADHYAYLHFFRPDIPIFTSDITKRLLQATEETATSGAFVELTTFRETFGIRPSARGGGMTRAQGEEVEIPRPITLMNADKDFLLSSDITARSFPVDHSVPGATAYVLTTASGTLVYTGDFRFHGYQRQSTQAFVEAIAQLKPNVILCEGTRIADSDGLTEDDVRNQALDLVRQTIGLVIINWPMRDVERLRSFLEVARASGRRLAVTLKQAYLLKLLNGEGNAPLLDDKNIAIYVDRKSWGLITKPEYPANIREQDYQIWEREFLTYPNIVTCEDIRKNQKDFMVRVDFFSLTDLVDLKPVQGSCYIRSVTEPFDDEGEIELAKAEEWLKLFGLYPYYQIHASGHASGDELKEAIAYIHPKVIIPVHTEHPERFTELLKGLPCQVQTVSQGDSITL